MNILQAANAYAAAGLSIIPCRRANKRPCIEWRQFQSRIASPAEIRATFSTGADAVAVICGAVSGGLEVIDFDGPRLFERWKMLIQAEGRGELLRSLVIQRTPSGGHHVFYRCPGAIEGNQKLAIQPGTGHGGIETRGEGGYVLVAPSAGYSFIQGSPVDIGPIDELNRLYLLDAARSLTEAEPEPPPPPRQQARTVFGGRPGDDFAARVSWEEILKGWSIGHRPLSGGRYPVTRPGKNPHAGHSATISPDGVMLHVFSSNAPLPIGHYDKLGAYARLHFRGDIEWAVRTLARIGFGDRR